jgi:WD40 repeat protein
MFGLIAGTVAAAFFIWLTVRACNRRERWAITLAEGLAAGAVLIALGSQAAPEVNGHWWTAVCAVAFSADGNTLAAGHFDGKAYNEDFHYRIRDLSQSVALFDAKTGTNSRALTQVRDPGPYSGFAVTPLGTFVAFSPDGSMLAIGSYDGRVQLWDLRTGMFKQTLTPQSSRLKAVAFSKDGKKLIAAGSFVTVWDTDNFGPGQRIETSGLDVSVACWPDSTRLAVGGQAFAGVEIVDLSTGKVARLDPNRTDRVLGVALSPDARYLAFGEDELVVAWSLEEKQKEFEVAAPWPRAIAFSPDGQTLATAVQNGLQFWNARTGVPIDGLPAPRGVVSLAYSNDGRLLALGDRSGDVSVWDVESRSRLWSAHMSGPHRWPGFWTIVTGVSALVLIPLMVRQLSDRPGWTGGRAGETHPTTIGA